MRIFLIGFMGSGKTTLGKKLAHQLNYRFIDLDKLIEEKQNKTISDIFEENGEESFREIEHHVLLTVLKVDNAVIATGGGTPCFKNNIQMMNNHGKTIYIKVETNELVKRLINTNLSERPLIKNKTEKELSDYIEDTLKKREKYYLMAQHIYNSETSSVKDLLILVQSS